MKEDGSSTYLQTINGQILIGQIILHLFSLAYN